MRPFLSGAASGVVIGISAVVLLQQIGLLSFSDLVTGLVYLLAAAIAAGFVFGIGGSLLSSSATNRAKAILGREGTGAEPSSTKTSDESDSGTAK